MVRSLLVAVGKEVRGMHQAAYLLAMFALGSQLLALVRDRLFASTFGASATLDVYYAAFRVPDLVFATVASLLSLYALLPVISRLEEEGRVVAFIRVVLLYFFVAMAVISGVLFFFAPTLVALVAPGVAGPDLVLVTRILLLQPILLGASNIVASLTQLRHRFVLYSISPLLYNIGIIAGVMWLYPALGMGGLAWGVVLGAALHLLVQLPFLRQEDTGTRMSAYATLPHVREVLWLSVPRTLALAAGQVTLLVFTALASLLSKGSITVFTFAYNLAAVPLTIIGVSYSVAAFPTLSRLHTSGERGEFVRHIETALRHILFWSIPATVLVIVLRAQLVRTILGAGLFDWAATRLTAAALALFIVSLAAQSISLLIARGYYAAGKTLKPLLFAGLFVATSILTALLLIVAFHTSELWRYFLELALRVDDIAGTTVLMLALGYTLGALLQAGVGLYTFARDFGLSLRPLMRLSFQSFAAGVLGGVAAYAALATLGSSIDINTALGVFSQGALAGLAGVSVSAIILILLKNEEIAEVYRSLAGRLRREPPAIEPTDVS